MLSEERMMYGVDSGA